MGLFGSKFPDTEKLESLETEHKRLFQEVLATANSQELKEYTNLKDELNSPEFKKEKSDITRLRWKNTKEYSKLKEYKRLLKNRDIKAYFSLVNSPELEAYIAFKGSDAYIGIRDKKLRKESGELQRFYNFESSKTFKSYQKIDGSGLIKTFEALKAKVETQEFKDYQLFCENKNRWTTTEGAKKEARFKALENDINIQNYIKYHNSDIFDLFKKYEITFSEDFAPENLDTQKWNTQFYLGSEFGKGNYSKSNYLNAYTNGRNIAVSRDYLSIETKNETTLGKVWDEKLGFYEKELNYTSGVISTGKSFKQEQGIFKVKLKTESHPPLSHSIQLISPKGDVQVKLLQISPKGKVMVGISVFDGKHHTIRTTNVKGLKLNTHFYIVSFEWLNEMLIWKINNKEVYRTEIKLPANELFLEIASVVYKTRKHPSPGRLILDWVKAYKKTA